MDQSEFEHHQAQKCTQDALDFTFNAMKYAVKVTKREQAGPLVYPLNYLLHQRLIPLYLEDSILTSNF